MENCANYRSFLALFCICSFFFLPVWGSEISPSHLSAETQKRFSLVPEFAFIMEEAEKLGVKVYLFGGTASAFAHYVRWDLEREAGDNKYQAERFDYDFTNIYRGNQDLDIVVDGTAEQARALRKILQETYPHFMGDREAWEVRLLRASMGDKKPLLDDYDFKNQHTDTNSTGMLALNPSEGEIVYRDLLDWENPESEFLKDVASAKIKFLYNDKHETTSRFKDGKNPPILAAIRYLAKLTQYEVEGTPKDLETVKQIIARTRSKEFNPYVRQKASEFGLKALLNAPDVEYAWNLLEETGARTLLIKMNNQGTNTIESLSWWFNKEPLRSFEIGQGDTETAAEIFGTDEIILAHETKSFLAYENITRSSQGKANVFISRQNTVGESAAFGDGFYTRVGEKGARGTGLTVRFKLHPLAKKGKDFITSGDYVIIKNKDALTLIQENLNISIVDYIKLLDSNEITENDKGLIAKFNRKFKRLGTDSQEFREAIHYTRKSLFLSPLIPEHLRFEFQGKHFQDFDNLISLHVYEKNSYYSRLMRRLLDLNDLQLLDAIMLDLIERGNIDLKIIQYALSKASTFKNTHWLEALLYKNKPELDQALVAHALFKPYWKINSSWDQWIKRLLKRGNRQTLIKFFELLRSTSFISEELHEWLRIIAKKRDGRFFLVQDLFTRTRVKIHFIKWIKEFIDLNDAELNAEIIQKVLTLESFASYPELVDQLLDKNDPFLDAQIALHILSELHWNGEPKWMKIFIERNNPQVLLNLMKPLAQMNRRNNTNWIDKILDKNHPRIDLWAAKYIFWKERGEYIELKWLKKFLKLNSPEMDRILIKHALYHEHMTGYSDVLIKLIQKNDPELDQLIEEHLFKQRLWREALGFKFMFLGRKLTAKRVRQGLKIKSFFKNPFSKKWTCESLLQKDI